MSSTDDAAGAEEAARFLARFSPFHQLEAAQLEDVAEHAELRSFPAGTGILRQAAQPTHESRLGSARREGHNPPWSRGPLRAQLLTTLTSGRS